MGLRSMLRSFIGPDVEYIVTNRDIVIDGFDIAELYKTQPNLQAVVSFIADNIAQLPLKVYRREDDNVRIRVSDSVAAKLLMRPNENMTCFELIRTTMSDYELYGRCLWLIMEDAESPSGWSIYPIPNEWIINYHGKSGFSPDSIDIKSGNTVVNVKKNNFLVFHNYNPASPATQTSPVEALTTVLFEQIEADKFRTDVWKNNGRLNAYISRPATVRPWNPEQADRFKKAFSEGWGKGGAKSGSMPVLEDGMEIKNAQFNAREAQWADAKKLTREDVAAIYHINPSLIWHTEGQTYASAKDNARALYADTLAPILRMLQDRINAFLLPRIGADEIEYVEFDIQAKLQGSFEEQATVLQTSVGAPWLTRNEARARNNLPPVDGGDELIVPLNVIEGGLASPTDTARPASSYNNAPVEAVQLKMDLGTRFKTEPPENASIEFVDVYKKFFDRQASAILPKIGAKSEWWDSERWIRELAEDLYEVAKIESPKAAYHVLETIGYDMVYNFEITEEYLKEMCKSRSETINQKTYDLIVASLGADVAKVFEKNQDRANKSGSSMACGIYAFSTMETLRQADANGFSIGKCTKTWLTTSNNPRASHLRMNGQTVPYNQRFSNGADFPQDRVLEAGESCNCQCIIEIYIP